MAEIKGHDGDIHRLHIAETTENTAKKKKNKKIRVASVDVFRGLTVAGMSKFIYKMDDHVRIIRIEIK
ncbi:hypothetical protein R6Q57_016161 [Mikania cordata]